MNFKIINIKAVEAAQVRMAPQGFRYGYLENFFKKDVYHQLVITYPDINDFKLAVKSIPGNSYKRFYVGPVYYSSKNLGCFCHFSVSDIWRQAINELTSPEFINILQQTTDIKFNNCSNLGFSYGKEGCVQETHLDGAVRANDQSSIHSTIACLLYLNEQPGGSTGTYICDKEKKQIIFKTPNLRNSFMFFEQHPQAWHGFPPVPAGEDRRIISLAFNWQKKPLHMRTSIFHKTLCPYVIQPLNELRFRASRKARKILGVNLIK